MLFFALEIAELGLLSKFWLDFLANGSGSHEEQKHNISLAWAKFPTFSLLVALTIPNEASDIPFNEQYRSVHWRSVCCINLELNAED